MKKAALVLVGGGIVAVVGLTLAIFLFLWFFDEGLTITYDDYAEAEIEPHQKAIVDRGLWPHDFSDQEYEWVFFLEFEEGLCEFQMEPIRNTFRRTKPDPDALQEQTFDLRPSTFRPSDLQTFG